jgi:hypothetical protein
MIRTAARTAAIALVVGAATMIAGAGTASAQEESFVYVGEATITIANYGYCGFSAEPAFIGEQTFTVPVTLTTSDPVSDTSGTVEDNPFHFTFQTDEQYGTGAFSVSTAQVAATSGGGAVLQYWTSDYDSATGALNGTLTEDHAEEAAAYNLVQIDQLLIPCSPNYGVIPTVKAMGEGSQFVGSLDTTAASIELAGVSADGLTEYHVTTSLTRI